MAAAAEAVEVGGAETNDVFAQTLSNWKLNLILPC
jgi:hypothetical protein